MKNKLEQLASMCRGDVALFLNGHKSSYETIEEYLNEVERKEDISSTEVLEKIIDKGIVVELIFYPNTPVGSYTVIHYDVDLAIDEALEFMDELING